jgi:chemotaxis signal transduction protein
VLPSRDRKEVVIFVWRQFPRASASGPSHFFTHPADKPDVETRAGQYITFRVARQDFAMEASCVRGILPARELVPVGLLNPELTRCFSQPYFSQWMSGFASLSGRDFPVIDLRAKLGLTHATHGRQPYIVVVEIKTADGPRLVGFIADRVCELVQARDRDFHLGKLRLAGRPRQVLDPDSLLADSASAEVTP